MSGLRAVSPTGSPIVGSLERISGVADIDEESWKRGPTPHTVGFEYGGYTDVDWNSQETVVRQGHRIFIDEDGAEWAEHKIKLVKA